MVALLKVTIILRIGQVLALPHQAWIVRREMSNVKAFIKHVSPKGVIDRPSDTLSLRY